MTKITDNAFEFGNQKYFRGNAHLLGLGIAGEKKDRIGAKAYVDPQTKVKAEHLVDSVQKGQVVTIDWSQTSKASVEANGEIKVFGLNVSVAKAFSYEKLKSAKLKLLNFSIPEGALKKTLNNGADGVRSYLAKEGNDGRVVSEVMVVMEAELGEHFESTASGSIAISADGADIKVTAKGGKQGTQSITLSEGSTFAYKLHKVKKWNKNKTAIEDMEADYKGIG